MLLVSVKVRGLCGIPRVLETESECVCLCASVDLSDVGECRQYSQIFFAHFIIFCSDGTKEQPPTSTLVGPVEIFDHFCIQKSFLGLLAFLQNLLI